MAWDPALVRKYNTTSHFRLLNQIRSELREQPIQRPLVTSRSAASSGSAGSGSRRPFRQPELPSAPSDRSSGRRRSSATTASMMASAVEPRDDHPQTIMAVPVLTDLVLPDAHT